jgi:iron complex outermembrane receptor protein
MRTLFGCFIAGFILLLCGNGNAQNKFAGVQGQILLKNNLLADSATVILIRLRDSSVIATIISGKNGAYKFEAIIPDTYILSIKRAGYQNYTSMPLTLSNTLLTLPIIRLLPQTTVLKDVTITNKKAYIETRPDKTILNIEKGILTGGLNVMDILGSAPGVKINSGGDVLLRANQKAAIAINGRLLNVGGRDMVEQLQNMSIDNISQIELINNPSAKYDASGSGGVINIILKKGKNDGFNGSVTQGVGYGNFYKLNSGLSVNYRAKAINFFGTYSFGENNTDHTIITNRYVATTTGFDVNYYNKQKTYASNYSFGADYDINADHTIGFLIIGAFNNNFLNKNTSSLIFNGGMSDSLLTTVSVLNRHVDNVNYNINYTGKLGHTGQVLSADFDYFAYNRKSAEDLNSMMYNVHTGVNAGMQYFRNEAPTCVDVYSAKVDYVNTISKTRKLEAGLKSVFARSNNIQRFDNEIGSARIPDPLISSQFNYNENISSAYANYIATPTNKFNYLLTLRVEHTESDANTVNEKFKSARNYTDVFPGVTFNYNASANHAFTVSYNRRIDRPNYQDLNPLIAFQDKYNFNMGNAYLRPAYVNKIQLSHTYKGKMITSLYASLAHDFYDFTYFTQNDATKVFSSAKTNLRRANTYGVNLTGPVDVSNWWTINYDIDISYQHFVDYPGLLDQRTFDAIFKLNQQFQLPCDIAASLDAQYEVPTYYAIYRYKASYNIRPAISKKLFHKNGTFSLSVKDVFNTNRDRYSTTYSNLNLVGYDKKETRVYSLSFAYRFGKSTVKALRQHEIGTSDDSKRVTGTN